MAWIESHTELAHHPKTRKLARLLECSIPTAVGHLHCLWHWALDHAFDGDLSGYESEDIAVGAMWDGDPEVFVKALISAKSREGTGFVDQDGERLVLHDWESYTAHLRARRESAGKANHIRWHSGRNVHIPSCEWCRNPNGIVEESPTESEPPATGEQSESERSPNGFNEESTVTVTKQKPEPEPEPKIKRARAISSDFELTPALREWGEENFPRVELVAETQKFIDHFTANGKPMKDWTAAWRNWIRRASEFAPRSNGSRDLDYPDLPRIAG